MALNKQVENPVFTLTESDYKKRLNILGFTDLVVVVDAACGTGTWTKHLADFNQQAIGFDIDAVSIQCAQLLLDDTGHTNTHFIAANLLKQPFPADSVDGIFCFGALMYANPLQVFREFHRILRRKRRAYASMNAPGWALYCILHRGLKKRDFHKVNMGLRMFYDTFIRRLLSYEAPIVHTYFTQKDLRKLAKATGFKVIHTGYEGSFKNENFECHEPCFLPKYLGLTCSLEILMEKA